MQITIATRQDVTNVLRKINKFIFFITSNCVVANQHALGAALRVDVTSDEFRFRAVTLKSNSAISTQAFTPPAATYVTARTMHAAEIESKSIRSLKGIIRQNCRTMTRGTARCRRPIDQWRRVFVSSIAYFPRILLVVLRSFW
jgi:hypothetical protein